MIKPIATYSMCHPKSKIAQYIVITYKDDTPHVTAVCKESIDPFVATRFYGKNIKILPRKEALMRYEFRRA